MDAVLHHIPRWIVASSGAVDSVPLVRDRNVVGCHGKRGREYCLWQGDRSNSQEVQGHVLHLLPEYRRDGVPGRVRAVQLADCGPSLRLSDRDLGGVSLAAAVGAEPCAHEAKLVMELVEGGCGLLLPLSSKIGFVGIGLCGCGMKYAVWMVQPGAPEVHTAGY